MNRKLLATAICAGLFATGTAYAQSTSSDAQAQSNQAQQTSPTSTAPQSQNKKEKTLQTITVTGSLIPQAQIQTASPVITITSKDIETQGFRNVYDALKSQPISTGSVQDSQFTAGFTPAANTISLFGLDPGFTLILMDGHPLANYPVPYNGTGNFVDLATIPTSVIDHIDILSGGQSSLYGSSAIAGVVNIVLKKHVEGTDISFRGGGYSDGGGQNERLTISGGGTKGKFDYAYALQLDNQSPIWNFQRSGQVSTLDDPTGQGVADRLFLIASAFGTPDGNYVRPPNEAATCQQLQGLFGGTTGYDYRPNHGYYCGSYYRPGYSTMLNQNKDANGYVNLTYHLNDNTELYWQTLYSWSKPTYNGGPYLFTYYNPALANSGNSFAQYFYNANNGDIELWQHEFAPEEIGGIGNADTSVLTKQYNTNIGVRGNIGQSNWAYDAYYNRSEVSTFSKNRWPLNAPFDAWYLGPQQGTDPFGYGFPAFSPNEQRFYTPLTPAQYNSMTDFVKSASVSWQQNLSATVTNTNLFDLPGGPVGFAGVVEWGNQAFNNPVDPRVETGQFIGLTGTSGSGSRKRAAVGAELRVPVFKMLTADLSARYDRYDSGFRTDAKPTYKAGLEFRPWDTLLLRATYATSFRAPDMEYLFAKNSGFYTSGVDYYLCRKNNPGFTNPSQCVASYSESLFARNNGNPNLQDVTAKSFGYGAVWSPTSKFDLKVDYQHIKIDNEVQTQSLSNLLQTEADCRLGTSFGGQPYDVNSPTCVDALSRVIRYPANAPFVLAQNTIQYLSVGPINIASEWVDGIQAQLDYKVEAGRFGDFTFGAAYYDELNHKFRNKPGDPEIDELHNYNSSEFKTIGNATVNWAIGNWSTTLHAIRYGHSVNAGLTGMTGPYITYNANVRYTMAGGDAYIQLTANNLFNQRPPVDASSGYPYYNIFNFNNLGRAVFVEFGAHLGAGKSE